MADHMTVIEGEYEYADYGAEYSLAQEGSIDRRWLSAVLYVSALTALGTIFAFATVARLYPMSFSARASWVYVPLASLFVFFLGWFRFPIAAALFYGYLWLGQAAGASYFLIGDVRAALTFEMVLAIPLIITGFLGSPASGERPSRSLPGVLKLSFVLIVAATGFSTVLALSPSIAVMTLFSRLVVPLLVTLAVARRLRGLDEYKIVWFGLVVGMLLVVVFDFRRIILGEGILLRTGGEVYQRHLGVTPSFTIPALYMIGGALWLGYVTAEVRSLFKGLLWLLFVAATGMLMWLSATRGTVVGLALLLLWWFPKKFIRSLIGPRTFWLMLIGAVAALALVLYSFGRTTADPGLIVTRLGELWEQGIRGSNRWPVWVEAMSHWKSNPMFGVGPNNWMVVNDYFASVHSSVVGILFDTGIFGLVGYGIFFVSIFLMARKKLVRHLRNEDQMFFIGCRAGWAVMLFVLVFDLPFTSGQPQNNIFSYVVLFFPLLVMTIYTRHPEWGLGGYPSVEPAEYESQQEDWAETVPGNPYPEDVL